jgi:hypothetical protein
LDRDSSLLKNFENKEYSSSQIKNDYLEALNKLQDDPIKVKILRGNDYKAQAEIMLDIKNSCIEKYKLFLINPIKLPLKSKHVYVFGFSLYIS